LDPDFLASPPQSALELLQRVREMIASAKGRIANFRFKPTLLVIPEDDYFYQDSESNQSTQHISCKSKSLDNKESKENQSICDDNDDDDDDDDDDDSSFHENQEEYLDLSDDQTWSEEDENCFQINHVISNYKPSYVLDANCFKGSKISRKEMIVRISQNSWEDDSRHDRSDHCCERVIQKEDVSLDECNKSMKLKKLRQAFSANLNPDKSINDKLNSNCENDIHQNELVKSNYLNIYQN